MSINKLNKYQLVLASNSPRRKELLASLDLAFEVRLPQVEIEESYPSSLKSEEIPLYLARNKAENCRDLIKKDEILIAADTLVLVNEKVLGKPANREEAIAYLTLLSGKTHQVSTGVSLLSTKKERTFLAKTEVSFSTLSIEDIHYYIDKYQPYDKAGAYGVQEWIGYIAVEKINGSFFNVMGLPVHLLYKELLEFIS